MVEFRIAFWVAGFLGSMQVLQVGTAYPDPWFVAVLVFMYLMLCEFAYYKHCEESGL